MLASHRDLGITSHGDGDSMTNLLDKRDHTDVADGAMPPGGVTDLIARLHGRAGACLLASRLCLVALFVAFACGVILFSWANKLVDVSVSLSPPTNISVSGTSQPVITVDQRLSKETADTVLGMEWKIRVVNQASALVARLGVVLLLIFLMQFMMRLFRYYHAAHLFFLVRAEALSLSAPATIDLDRALQFLSPQSLEFGGLPKSPMESAISGAKLALDATKGKSAG